jgi:Protein of unknown function (DUF3606)
VFERLQARARKDRLEAAEPGLPGRPLPHLKGGGATIETGRRFLLEKETAMPDDKHKAGSLDGKLISLTEDYEVEYWTRALGVSKERLMELIERHGNSAQKIRHALGQWK